jgi:Protein of unknown function (DUF2950)
MNHATNIKSSCRNSESRKSTYAMPVVLWSLLLLGTFLQRSSAADTAPRTFPTPQAAADALIDAAEKSDVAALEEIFGPAGKEIIDTGEPALDRERAKQFAGLARTKMKVSLDPKSKRRAFISVGNDDWPFPVPIVKSGTTWAFDPKAGLNEILLRRIGQNELSAIAISHGFVEAQNEYAMAKHGDSQVNQYAQKIISTPGKQDGLAWQNPDGTWDGPVGENVARAIERGYSSRTEPYHGYYFKVLKGQGPDAPLGQMDYVVNGAMIGGYALIAFPARYQDTGVKTFMVSNDGVVYQKDLGPNTLELAQKIDRFNPDKTWSPVVEE